MPTDDCSLEVLTRCTAAEHTALFEGAASNGKWGAVAVRVDELLKLSDADLVTAHNTARESYNGNAADWLKRNRPAIVAVAEPHIGQHVRYEDLSGGTFTVTGRSLSGDAGRYLLQSEEWSDFQIDMDDASGALYFLNTDMPEPKDGPYPGVDC